MSESRPKAVSFQQGPADAGEQRAQGTELAALGDEGPPAAAAEGDGSGDMGGVFGDAPLPEDGARVYTKTGSPGNVFGMEDGDEEVDIRQALFTRAKSTLVKEFGGHHDKFPPPSERLKRYIADLESLDYDEEESRVAQSEMHKKTVKTMAYEEFLRWVAVLLIGICTGLVAFFIDYFARLITLAKFDATFAALDSTNGSFFPAVLVFVGISTGLVAIAGGLVSFVEWSAAGSGIPEIKCYLNGMNIPKVVRATTLVSKAVGVLFSVSGGLAVGKEGPMIHSGAIVAAGISQGRNAKIDFKIFEMFRNDHEKRDFVSSGAAAGVAAAFGAPIGGVLFSLEEGASFWNQPLTWRTFFCAMVSTFTLNIFLSGTSTPPDWGGLNSPGLINFGSFSQQRQPSYKVWELGFFALLGIAGGLFGALFNELNTHLTNWRMRTITTKWTKFSEALVVGFVTSFCAICFPYYLGQCKPIPAMIPLGTELRTMNCPDGTYNDLATIFFQPQEDAIRHLFHNEGMFSPEALLVFFIVIFSLACWTYGVSVPSGLFVPSLLTGCAYGRLVGHVLRLALPGQGIDPGTYALVGAASMLGGVARMTISLTVIILESTNDIKYGMPIMLTIMVAKWVGDLFNAGIYDVHIEIKHIPFLEWEAPAVMNTLFARDVMADKVICLQEFATVQRLVRLLRGCPHNGFPIVAASDGPSGGRQFYGLILRHQIVSLIKNRQYAATQDDAGAMPRLPAVKFAEHYPHYKSIDDFFIPESAEDMWMDLRPYMNPAAYVINQHSPLTRVFRVFRSLGLRHLVVVNKYNEIEGIISRKDITHHACVHALSNLAHARAASLLDDDDA